MKLTPKQTAISSFTCGILACALVAWLQSAYYRLGHGVCIDTLTARSGTILGQNSTLYFSPRFTIASNGAFNIRANKSGKERASMNLAIRYKERDTAAFISYEPSSGTVSVDKKNVPVAPDGKLLITKTEVVLHSNGGVYSMLCAGKQYRAFVKIEDTDTFPEGLELLIGCP